MPIPEQRNLRVKHKVNRMLLLNQRLLPSHRRRGVKLKQLPTGERRTHQRQRETPLLLMQLLPHLLRLQKRIRL